MVNMRLWQEIYGVLKNKVEPGPELMVFYGKNPTAKRAYEIALKVEEGRKTDEAKVNLFDKKMNKRPDGTFSKFEYDFENSKVLYRWSS